MTGYILFYRYNKNLEQERAQPKMLQRNLFFLQLQCNNSMLRAAAYVKFALKYRILDNGVCNWIPDRPFQGSCSVKTETRLMVMLLSCPSQTWLYFDGKPGFVTKIWLAKSCKSQVRDPLVIGVLGNSLALNFSQAEVKLKSSWRADHE